MATYSQVLKARRAALATGCTKRAVNMAQHGYCNLEYLLGLWILADEKTKPLIELSITAHYWRKGLSL